jgi:hypothetical protein
MVERLKLLFLGAIIGGGVVYWIKDDNAQIIEKKAVNTRVEKISNKNEEVASQISSMKKDVKEENIVNQISEKPQGKERMKTPDELFREQEQAKYDSLEVREVEPEVDRDIMPIELEQSELSAQSNVQEPMIDRTIIPEALEVEENASPSLNESDLAEEIPEMNPEEDTTEEEPKEVIPEELSTLEEYGDDENIPDEDEIPN